MTVKRWLSVLMTTAMLGFGGCQVLPDLPQSGGDQSSLLDGSAVFGEPVSADEAADVDILELTPDMVEFLDRQIGDSRISAVRFRRLYKGLAENGYFETSYLADTTRTAAETFHDKSGNCLSYTNMFIALARQAGLDAEFQIVDVPPDWDADSGYLIRYTHVNVLLKGFVFDPRYGEDFSVDFNDVLPDPEYSRHVISDVEATSLFYANRSVGLLRSGELRAAFVLLKKAIELAPEHPDLWINLGAFYSKQLAHGEALKAYETAWHYDRSNRAAISGMARSHYLLGNLEQSEVYAEQVRRYRQRNPYYHFAIAQAEFENARYSKALVAINLALDLKYRNGRFHFLKGLTEQKLGNPEAAEASFRRATRYGNYRELKQRYVGDVADTYPLG